jgi:hypothetical protein
MVEPMFDYIQFRAIRARAEGQKLEKLAYFLTS